MTIGLSPSPTNRKHSVMSIPDRRGSSTSAYRCFQNYYHGHRFLNPHPSYISNVRLSVNHWQLRDLVQIDASTGSIFHTYEENIRVLSMRQRPSAPLRSRNHLSLPYRPRCFNHAPGGLVVSGGVLTSSSKVFSMNLPVLTKDFKSSCKPSKGLFSIYSPAMGEEMSFQLGEMINNAVTIYPQQNSTASYTSYVCNNDSNLYIIDVSDSGITGDRKIVCEANTSLNNVYQSPNSRVVTVTGDSGSVFLLDPAMPQPLIKTISSEHDTGFGISYHNNEVTLAVAFQDGTCSLYDVRKTEAPIHEIKSTRAGHQSGAFRTCKFLNSSVQDLLAVSEHVGRVHLIDMRDFSEENHQVIVFPFALDQFSRYKNSSVQLEDDFETDIHKTVNVFDNDSSHFTAPLVYDYSYLTDYNPKLFKDYIYEPPPNSVEEEEAEDVSGEKVSPPVNRISPLSAARNWSSGNRSSFASENCVATQQDQFLGPPMDQNVPSNADDRWNYARQSKELYQQSVNHINGEMEISGMDWHGNQLFIGCEDGGLLVWDVNVRARRSFGSFSQV